MHISATNKMISELMVDLEEGRLKPNPDFQRRLVWSNADKVFFIKTVLEGYPFPEIFLAKGDLNINTGKSTAWIVDGQQRITTLHQYFTGASNLKLPDDMKSYTELEDNEKKSFLSYTVAVRDLGAVDLEEVKEVFRRINSTSYDLNAMEVNNASYNGPLKKLAEKIARGKFFSVYPVFTANDARRMQDTLFILVILITCMSDYFTSDTQVEEYLKRYNEDFPEKRELNDQIKYVFDVVERMGFSEESRVWKKADFFTLVIELHRFLFKDDRKLKVRATAAALGDFYDKVDVASKQIRAKGKTSSKNFGLAGQYYDTAAQATTSKKNREVRGQIIYDLLK